MEDDLDIPNFGLISVALRASAVACEAQAAALRATADAFDKTQQTLFKSGLAEPVSVRQIMIGPLIIDPEQQLLRAYGKSVHYSNQKILKMLVYLAEKRGKFVTRTLLISLFFSDERRADPAASLRAELHILRRHLVDLKCEKHLYVSRTKLMLSSTEVPEEGYKE